MTPDEEAKANRQGSLLFALGGREGFYFTITGKIPALRTVVLVIWTNEKRKKKQIFEKLKEKKIVLQSVRKINTNVQARRLKRGEYT